MKKFADAPVISIPAFQTPIADTAGVGDTHIAEMCAGLVMGYDLETACLMANAGAALAVSHSLPCPFRRAIRLRTCSKRESLRTSCADLARRAWLSRAAAGDMVERSWHNRLHAPRLVRLPRARARREARLGLRRHPSPNRRSRVSWPASFPRLAARELVSCARGRRPTRR